MEKLNLKFKDGVYGFIYESMYGDIVDIIKEPITKKQSSFFNKYSGEYDVLFTSVEDIIDLFEIKSKDDVDEFWDEILEVVE
jgi:hypothetical protein